MTSLRDRLRADTAPWHERVDRAYTTLDLRQAADLGTFLGAQLSVLLAIRCRPGPHAEAANELRACMAVALRADLHHLDRAPVLPQQARRFDATSVLYILLGSRLGTRVLHRRWLETTDPAVKGAGSYLGLAPPSDAWRALCGELMQRPHQSAEADRVIGDACLLFDLHLRALAALEPAAQGEPHAA